MTKHICHDSSCRGLFHCDHCGDTFDLQKHDIVGIQGKNGEDMVVCEGCARQLGAIK